MKPFVVQPTPRIIFGCGEIARLGESLSLFAKRVVMVTGRKTARRLGYTELVRDQLTNRGIRVKIFAEVGENPTHAMINRGGVLAAEFRADAVLGLGGGSAMDAAKLIAAAATVRRPEVWRAIARKRSGTGPAFTGALPIVCVPTLAASGSEANATAVVSNPETHEKIAVHDDLLLPVLAVVDPDFTCSVDAARTAWGAFDIITHALETYFTARTPAPLQDRFSESIVRTVLEHLPRAMDNPLDKEARSVLSWCSTTALSGAVAGRWGAFPVHWIENALSGRFPVLNHGRGLTILLPRVMRWTARTAPEKAARLAREALGASVAGKSDAQAAREAVDTLLEFQKNAGIAETLADAGVDPACLDDVIKDVLRLNGHGGSLDNPRPLDADGLREILQDAFGQ